MSEPTEMELRVAKAIFAKMFPECPDDFSSDEPLMACYIDTARAAIGAMREPTREMTWVGMGTHEEHESVAESWAAMIDAALSKEDA